MLPFATVHRSLINGPKDSVRLEARLRIAHCFHIRSRIHKFVSLVVTPGNLEQPIPRSGGAGNRATATGRTTPLSLNFCVVAANQLIP
jgi:hypothetical protein